MMKKVSISLLFVLSNISILLFETYFPIDILSKIEQPIALDYYWVGGEGHWSQFDSHWATTSGGTEFHERVPTSIDNVYFDLNSFSDPEEKVTIDETIAYCANMVWTGVGNNPKLAGDPDKMLIVYGQLTLVEDMDITFEGPVHFKSNGENNKITTAGQNIPGDVFFDGIGGEWTLQDGFIADQRIYHSQGTLNTNDQPVEIGALFYSVDAGSRILKLGNSTITINGGWYNIPDVNSPFSFLSTTNNLTVNAGTSTIVIAVSELFWGGGQDFYNVTFNTTSFGNAIINTNILGKLTANNDLKFNGHSNYGNYDNYYHEVELHQNAEIYGNNNFDILNLTKGKVYDFQNGVTQIINEGGQLNANGACDNFITIKSTLAGEQAFLNTISGIITTTYVAIQDMGATGDGIFIAEEAMDISNNSGWSIPNPRTPRTLFWIGGTGDWNNPDNWALSNTGVGGQCIPTNIDRVVFFENPNFTTNDVVTINTNIAFCEDMDWNGAPANSMLAGSDNKQLHIFGNLDFVNGMDVIFEGEVHFKSNGGNESITTAGQNIPGDVFFDGIGGEWTLQDGFIADQRIYHSQGILNTNDQSVEIGALFYSVEEGSRILNLGNSTITINGGWYNIPDVNSPFSFLSTTNNLTVNAGTSTIVIAVSELFWGGGQDFYNVTFNTTSFGNVIINTNILGKLTANNDLKFNGHSNYGNYDNYYHEVELHQNAEIYGNNNFDLLTLTKGKVYQLQNGASQTINDGGQLNANGACDNFLTLKSTLEGQQAFIYKNNGTIITDYLAIQDISATGGGGFIANDGVDISNNSGWSFSATVTPRTLYWVGNSGNWNEIDNWALSSDGSGGECIPTPFDTVIFVQNPNFNAGDIVTINVNIAFCDKMDWSGAPSGTILTGENDKMLFIFGHLTCSANMDLAFEGAIHFKSNGENNNITTAGQNIPGDIYFDGIGGEWTLQDGFIADQRIYHSQGTLNTNDQTVDIGALFYSVEEGSRILDLGNSTITIAGGWYNIPDVNSPFSFLSTTNNLTVNAGTSTIVITVSELFWGGGQDFYNVTFNTTSFGNAIINTNILGKLTANNDLKFNGHSNYGNYDNYYHEVELHQNAEIYGNNNFDILTFTAGKNYSLQSNSIQTVSPLGDFIAQGNGSFPIEITSTINGNQAVLHKDGDPICLDYLYLTDLKATGTGLSYVGEHSDDVFNNEGWIFDACPPCVANLAVAPNLNSTSVTAGYLGEQATLILDNIPVNHEAVWFDSSKIKEVYTDVGNNFQPIIEAPLTFYGGSRDLSTGCLTDLLKVDVHVIDTIYIEITTDFASCADATDITLSASVCGGAQSQGTGRFKMGEEWVGYGSYETANVSSVDFNGDGYLDLIHEGRNYGVEIWWNDQDGTFTNSLLNIPNGTKVVHGDFNGDGNVDIVSPVFFNIPGVVSINDGTGVFSPQSGLPFSSNLTYPHVVGDLNGDTYLDIVFGGNCGFTPVYNNGQAVFSEGQMTPLGCSNFVDIKLADVDNDGDLDILSTISSGARDNKIWLNDGAGNFTEDSNIFGSDGWNFDVGDINGDGLIDIVVANKNSPAVVWLNSIGIPGVFTQGASYGISNRGEIELVDYDKDGNLDVVIGRIGETAADGSWVMKGIGDGTFELAEDLNDFSFIGYNGGGVASGDFDKDGDIDIFHGFGKVYFNDDSNVIPYNYEWSNGATTSTITDLSAGVYTLTVTDAVGNTAIKSTEVIAPLGIDVMISPTSVTCPDSTNGMATAFANGGLPFVFKKIASYPGFEGNGTTNLTGDINNDGYIDAIVITDGPNGNHPDKEDIVWLNNADGTGTFSKGQVYVERPSRDGALGDVDGDGDLDIYVTGYTESYVRFGNGDGTFYTGEEIYSDKLSGLVGQNWSIDELEDLDNDGDLDALLYGQNYKYQVIWWNDGDGTFTRDTTVYGTNIMGDVAMGDVDGDGDIDVFCQEIGGTSFILRNKGDKTFTNNFHGFGPQYIWTDVELLDINSDGHLDAIAAARTANYDALFQVFINDGTGNFTLGQKIINDESYNTAYTVQIDLADIDNDGDMDFATMGNSKIYMNDGNANFTPFPFELEEGGGLDLDLVDVDNDGDIDILYMVKDGMRVWLQEPNEYTYQWDAAADNQTTPTADSLSAGTYSVTITDCSNCMTVETVTVDVDAPECPSCEADFSYTIDSLGKVCVTDLSNSSSPITSSGWEFNYFALYNYNGDSYMPSASDTCYQYEEPGTYTVCRWVANAECYDTICKPIIIEIEASICEADFNYSINDCGEVCFTDLSTGPFTDANWYFIYGVDNPVSNLNDTCYQYDNSGSYTVCREIFNGECYDSICKPITINYFHEDYLVLMEFYNSTNGFNWTNNTNWGNSCDVCDWYGVACDEDNRVSNLYLLENNLSGVIPASIGALTNLITLNLSNNQLSGNIPIELGNLIKLSDLSMHDNQLIGSIPSELGNLLNLIELSLGDNLLTGTIPKELGNLINLSFLSLINNQLIGSIPVELEGLNNLSVLALNNNLLTGTIPVELGDLNNLSFLGLTDNQLTGTIPIELGNLTSLTYLGLSNNELTGTIPTQLGNLVNLESLYLYDNQLTGIIPKELGNLNKLVFFHLASNQLTGTIPMELGNLTSLNTLFVNNNQLEGCIPVTLKSFCNVVVDINNNINLEEEDFAAFCNTESGACIDLFCYPDTVLVGEINDVVTTLYAENISTSESIQGNSTIVYKAENSVILEPGFHATSDVIFLATIEECPPQILPSEAESRLQKITGEPADYNNGELKVYPNPFMQQTTIEYVLEKEERINLQLVNALGREVITLIQDPHQAAGTYKISFNRNQLEAGIYFVLFQHGDKYESKKLLILNR